MLDDLALPGDGGCIVLTVGEGAVWEVCGELFGFIVSPPPRSAEMGIPTPGLCPEEKPARSLIPANGETVGGPRGAGPGREAELGGI